MGRRTRDTTRRTPLQAGADRASTDLARRLGRMLRDARQGRALTQAQASERAGISRSRWSDLETGRDHRSTIATLNRAAHAVGGGLDAHVRQASAAQQPRDAVHLRNQELVIRAALGGGWQALPEEPIDREARTSRMADVLLHRRRPLEPAEYALIEVLDWFGDVGEPVRDWSRRLAALERYAIARMRPDDPLPRTGGCWIVRATQRNRRLIAEHRLFFAARFPGSSRAWLNCLTQPGRQVPREPGLLWVSVAGERIFPVRSSAP